MKDPGSGPQPTEEFYKTIASLYPPAMREHYAPDAGRLAFQAQIVFSPGATAVDVGSGLSPFALGLQKVGMKAVMVDRFDYPVELRLTRDVQPVLEMLRAHGVTVHHVDIASWPFPLADESADVVTCVACLEHLHKSPRSLFTEMVRILRPGGKLLLGCPNAVNLRKRFSVLVGRTNYPPVDQFWADGEPRWFGHVREPTLHELAWMARTAGLRVEQRLGRNFLARQNFGAWAGIGDRFLRLLPGLCSDIYVLAEKKII